MSSGMRQSFPVTSPTTFSTSAMLADGPPLVDDREGRVEPLGEPARHLGRADVGRHHHQVAQLLLPVVVHEHRRRVQVVHRQVEEPLELVLMEVHGQHPVRPRHRHHVGHQLGADRHPRLILPVLPGIPEVGNDRRDPGRAGPLGGVHEEQQLHHVLGRRVGGLDDVDVPPAHVLVDLDEHLAVGEAPERDLAERLPQMGGHLFGEGAVGRPAQEQHLAARQRQVRHGCSPQTYLVTGVTSTGAGSASVRRAGCVSSEPPLQVSPRRQGGRFWAAGGVCACDPSHCKILHCRLI